MRTRRPSLHTARLVALVQDIAAEQQEHVVCITLDSHYRVIARHMVFKGSLTACLLHPREIYKCALDDRAACIVIAHNHPSGTLTLTAEDITATVQLAAAGLVLGIPLKDHLVIAGQRYVSFRRRRLAGLHTEAPTGP